MIRSKDLNEDLKGLEVKLLKAEKNPDAVSNADVVKALVLVAKVIRDIRTNQVSWMKKEYGNEIFVKARRPTPDARNNRNEKTEKK